MLAAEYCRNLEGEAPLNPEGLMVVWSESDDGAALWYYGQLLAVIPGWSLYIDHSVCYSASCIKESPLAYPLGSASTNTQYAQAESTRQFWRSWQREEGNPWPKMQRDFQARYEPHFGPSVKYYAIDQGKWPPMAITQHERDGIYYFLTMGVSIRPMPWVEILFNDEASRYRRMEMAIAIDSQYMTEDNAVQMASALAGFAHAPWARLTGSAKGIRWSRTWRRWATRVIFYRRPSTRIALTALPQQYGDPVNLFWASPVFTAERQLAHATPNGGHDLVNRLREQGVDHIFRPRQPVC